MNDCKQCGTCCRKGGPALHTQDLLLLREADGIDLTDIVTLRKGELAYDQPVGAVIPLDGEILKIKGSGGEWICKFLAQASNVCRIYKSRPFECQKLFCEAPEPLMEVYDKDRVTRKDILPEGHPVLELIEEHDKKCDPAKMSELAAQAIGNWEESEAIQADLREMLIFDASVRELVMNKAGLPEESLDFFFGRPLTVLIKGYGIIATPSGKSFSLRKL